MGAGPAGLASLRALTAAGLDAVAYEAGGRVGGVWTLEPRANAAYRSLHLITSRARTEFAELPMPDDTPDYPSRDAIGRYLESYVEHFGLAGRIRLSAEVVATTRLPDGGWEVETASGDRERFDALVVANGHNQVPKLPDPPYPGEFAGRQLHAVDYDDPTDFSGARVMVVGMGNSAMDIASDVSLVTERTILSVRRGSWIVPKRLLGKPADQVVKPWAAVHVPYRVRQPLAEALVRITNGRPERYGLPAPKQGLFEAHPTISDTILSRISHGAIVARPGIERLDGDGVRFTDGSRDRVDAIIWCTGYRVEVPFLDPSLLGDDPSELPLYRRIFHLDVPDLYFAGFMQSTGSAFPIVERQAQLIAREMTGRWARPPRAEMERDCRRRRTRSVKRWGEHGRPTMRVDFDGFMHELAKELR